MLPARMSGRAIAAATTVVALLQQPAEVAEMPADVATCGTDNCWKAKIVGTVWPPPTPGVYESIRIVCGGALGSVGGQAQERPPRACFPERPTRP